MSGKRLIKHIGHAQVPKGIIFWYTWQRNSMRLHFRKYHPRWCDSWQLSLYINAHTGLHAIVSRYHIGAWTSWYCTSGFDKVILHWCFWTFVLTPYFATKDWYCNHWPLMDLEFSLCEIWNISMAWCKTAVTPLLTHWSYCSLARSHRYVYRWYPLPFHWCP